MVIFQLTIKIPRQDALVGGCIFYGAIFQHIFTLNIPKNDAMKIYNPPMDAPWQELSGDGLGFFVALLIGWYFFVHVH